MFIVQMILPSPLQFNSVLDILVNTVRPVLNMINKGNLGDTNQLYLTLHEVGILHFQGSRGL